MKTYDIKRRDQHGDVVVGRALVVVEASENHDPTCDKSSGEGCSHEPGCEKFDSYHATFAPAGYAVFGYAIPSSALHRIADQLISDATELRSIAERLQREGK